MAARARPPVAVVVCTHDRPDLLPAALESLGVTLAHGDELVVVESGDSGAGKAIAELRTAATTVHVRSTRREKSVKLNLGIATSSAEILLFTDDDARVDPAWPDEMNAPFADTAVGLVFGPVRGLTTHGNVDLPHVAAGEAPLATWDYADGASMAARRVAVDAVGGFDERLGPGAPAHGEEHDLLLRVRERGWRVVVAAAHPVTHLEWRDDEQTERNLLVYERGGGAVIGAALRRDARRWARLAGLRLRYQATLFRQSPIRWATLRAFIGGVFYGLRLRPWGSDRGR